MPEAMRELARRLHAEAAGLGRADEAMAYENVVASWKKILDRLDRDDIGGERNLPGMAPETEAKTKQGRGGRRR